MDHAPVRAAPGLPGGALDDRDMDDRERSGAIVRGGAYQFLRIRGPIVCPPFAKSRLCVRPDGRCLLVCRALIRSDQRFSCAGSPATITPCEPVVLHSSSASIQLGAHWRPACTRRRQQDRSKNIRRSQLLRCSKTLGPAADAQRRRRCRHRRLARTVQAEFRATSRPPVVPGWRQRLPRESPTLSASPVPLSAVLSF